MGDTGLLLALVVLVGGATLLGLASNASLFWAVRRLVRAVEGLVVLLTEVHRKVMVADEKRDGRLGLIETKVEHLEREREP